VSGADVETLLKLIEAIEDLDDVQKVWANFDIDDADLANL
jgi:transcriptional/translational regulatory protein YebC/TACO1